MHGAASQSDGWRAPDSCFLAVYVNAGNIGEASDGRENSVLCHYGKHREGRAYQACQGIHFDPWWNTAAENQASDRAHRIGQIKVVTVYKLVAKGTIEERIFALQQQKAKLAQDVLSGEGVGSAVLSREDLVEILGGESHLSAERAAWNAKVMLRKAQTEK